MIVNPLPDQVLKGIRAQVEAPPPDPSLFTKQDLVWLEKQVTAAVVSAYKSAPGGKLSPVIPFTEAERRALFTAMVQIAIGASTRALKKYFLALEPKFMNVHVQTCGLFGQNSNIRTKMDEFAFRIQSLEREAKRQADHVKKLE